MWLELVLPWVLPRFALPPDKPTFPNFNLMKILDPDEN